MAPPVAGYTVWYDFGDPATLFTDTGRTTPVTTDGDLIKGVTDKSASGFHLSQATTPPAYKTGVYNRLSTSRWDGTAKTLISGAATLAQPFTRCAVVKLTDNTADRIAVGGGGTLNALGPYRFGGNWTMYAGAQAGVASPITALLHVLTYVYNGGSSAYYIDGVTIASGINPGANGLTPNYEVGSYNSGTQIWIGDICEIIDYPSVLSTTDRQSVEAYLTTRWFDVGLPQFDPIPFIPQGRSM